MKSRSTPHTHTGVVSESFLAKVGPSGYEMQVPAGVACKKLDGGSEPWVVSDLSCVPGPRNGILYSDADIYGIRVPERLVGDIVEVKKVSTPSSVRRSHGMGM